MNTVVVSFHPPFWRRASCLWYLQFVGPLSLHQVSTTAKLIFFPWCFYHQHRNADFVAVTTQSIDSYSPIGTLCCLLKQLAIIKIAFLDTESLHMLSCRLCYLSGMCSVTFFAFLSTVWTIWCHWNKFSHFLQRALISSPVSVCP